MKQKTIYLDRNESNYGPAPECFEVLKNTDLTHLSYYTRAHEKGFKSILSEKIAKEFNVSRDQVLLGYGAEDLLKQAVQCFLVKGRKIMIPTYSWWYYKELASEAGGTDIEYPILIGEDSFYYDIDALMSMYDEEKPEIILISSPNNPTGNSIDNDDLEKILEYTKDAILILDEAYVSYTNPIDVKRLTDKYPNFMIIRTFSKYFALAGLRIGYAIVGEKLTSFSTLMNRYLGYNRLSEEVAIAAMEAKDYYAGIYNQMKADKEMYFNELNKIPGFKAFKSDANFMLVEIPSEIIPDLKAFMSGKGLIIKFMNEEILNSHLRITLGTQEENRMVVEAIKEFCAQ